MNSEEEGEEIVKKEALGMTKKGRMKNESKEKKEGGGNGDCIESSSKNT